MNFRTQQNITLFSSFFSQVSTDSISMQNHLAIHFDQGNCHYNDTMLLVHFFQIFLRNILEFKVNFKILLTYVSTYTFVFSEQYFILSEVNRRVMSNIN